MAEPRVLFLDIDGVLNSNVYFQSPRFAEIRKEVENAELGEKVGRRALDCNAVRRLQNVVDRTACVIVLSSTWRYYHKPEDMQRYMNSRGGETIIVVGRTPLDVELAGPYSRYGKSALKRDLRAGTHPRGYEIDQWLTENGPVLSYAIVDDDDDMVAHDPKRSAEFAERFVRTNCEYGLRQPQAERLIRILNTPLR